MSQTDIASRTIDGRDVTLPKEKIDDLRARHRGPVLLPGDPGFEDSRTVWNGMIDRKPALVLRSLGVADVVAGVNFARSNGLALCIKGGGHNIAGLAVADGAVMLDLGLMRGVFVDPAARIAQAQGGCLLGDVDRETQLHGLAAVLGFVSQTGVAGLTLGGGFGYLSRRFGWTSDNVNSMTLVTADGRIVRASATENADLFWGLCGGGGNFGVVTSIEYRLFPVGPEIWGGGIAWSADRTEQVLDTFRAIMSTAPPELALVAALRIAPPAPWVQKEAHGKPMVGVFVCHSGDPAQGEKLTAPLKAIPGVIGDIVQRRPYTGQQSLLDATQPKGRRYYWKSEYLPDIADGFVAKYREHGEKIRSPHSAVLLFPIGDAVAKQANESSAVGNRDARWVFNVAAAWDNPAEDAGHVDWARAAWRDLRTFSTGGTYVNFLTEEEGADRVKAAYGENLRRLGEIKKKWDPENLFRANKNIAPA
jgi:FAD/FMN-containing dehydrogenase